MDVNDSILGEQEDLKAVENILEHEDEKSARATARQMAAKEAAAKRGPPPPSRTATPTAVAEKKGMGHCGQSRRTTVGTWPRHASSCPNAKVASGTKT